MNELSTIEKSQLTALEKIIEKNPESFIKVGTALLEIRDSKLYRDTHETFEEYCRGRWGFGKSYVNDLIGSATAYNVYSQKRGT